MKDGDNYKDKAPVGIMVSQTYRKCIYLLLFVLVLWCIKGLWRVGETTKKNHTSGLRDMNDVNDGESINFLDPLEGLKLLKTISANEREIEYLKQKIKDCNTGDNEVFPKSHPIPIYVITPTYARSVQKAELTRLSHTFRLVPGLHWIIVEDSDIKTQLVTDLLKKSGVKYTHLIAATPKGWKLGKKEPHWIKPRGVTQRNTALQWIRDNVERNDEGGVLYFADDDNSYSLEIFEEMRHVKRVGVWPVGLVGGLKVERPKVENGVVTGWLTAWSPERPFAIDMAGFAINLNLFLERKEAKFAFEVEKGYQESELLKHFVGSLTELEPLADNCTKVLVWHTRTEQPNLRQEDKLRREGKSPSDIGLEV